MSQGKIDEILKSRQQAPPAASPTAATEDSKFFSLLLGEGLHEHFLEFRFQAGLRTCFPYDQLTWFNFDPEGATIDLEFSGYLITIKGRGLGERLFDGIKQKRIAWIKEADVEMEDNPSNAVFIEQILLVPPTFEEEEPAKD